MKALPDTWDEFLPTWKFGVFYEKSDAAFRPSARLQSPY